MPKWKFLTNHAIVLSFLAKHPLITGRELSRLIGITERTVRNIISDLESEGYIKKLKEGRQIKYKINPNLPFRHPSQKDKTVRILLNLFSEKPKNKKNQYIKDK